jgi:hypothetical protein
MVVDTLKYLVETIGIEIVQLSISYPLSNENELVVLVKDALQHNGNIRMCVFSHISSMVRSIVIYLSRLYDIHVLMQRPISA